MVFSVMKIINNLIEVRLNPLMVSRSRCATDEVENDNEAY